jgi:hypothetical protein
MKNPLSEKADQLKKIMDSTAQKSKENLEELIRVNNQLMGKALDSNKAIVDGIRKQFDVQDKNTPFFESLNKAFGKSVELSEESMDTIIDGYNKQIRMYVDFNTRLVDAIRESVNQSSNQAGMDTMLKLITDNFEQSVSSMNTNMKSTIDSYNKHTNLALNFNKKFGENVSAQLEIYKEFQSKNRNMMANWAALWGKKPDK